MTGEMCMSATRFGYAGNGRTVVYILGKATTECLASLESGYP